MRRAPWSSALFVAGLCLASGCSRPSGRGGGGEGEPSARVAPPLTAVPATSDASLPDPQVAPVPLPEDDEDAAEHRITEQNLESELDRLEREIQAE